MHFNLGSFKTNLLCCIIALIAATARAAGYGTVNISMIGTPAQAIINSSLPATYARVPASFFIIGSCIKINGIAYTVDSYRPATGYVETSNIQGAVSLTTC